ncbi:hypothetical protein C0993_009609 [Termitomyces sp. T159_Od127]|nr:hypothetical protein C0993_009609 [Termitomyces sp. T159_Od127]
MALNTAANLATIGSFAVDVFSLGLLTINKHEDIRDALQEAHGLLDDAIDRIANYSLYLNDEEFDTSMMECENRAKELVRKACQDRSSFETFIKTSVRAKRRVDMNQRMIDQHKMGERLQRMSRAGLKLLDSSSDMAATRDYEPEVERFLNLAPLPEIIDELNNPFQDSDQKENEDLATSSSTSLKSLTSGSE